MEGEGQIASGSGADYHDRVTRSVRRQGNETFERRNGCPVASIRKRISSLPLLRNSDGWEEGAGLPWKSHNRAPATWRLRLAESP